MELPKSFLDEMEKLLGPEFPAYLASLSQPGCQGIRVNTAKISPEEFCRIAPFSLEPVPWNENGFYVAQKDGAAKHPYYFAGLYYMQEPSAMLPAALLDVRPGDAVLDLCAAPGGKATELGSRLQGQGILVANDISASRTGGLLKNIELHGIANAAVCSESPEKLRQAYGMYFDRVLVDAPCSGEGMFRRDASMLRDYLRRGPSYYAGIQRGIAEDAVSMLKPGGKMVYSTCTFSRLENEETIDHILKRFPDMRLIKQRRLFPHRVRGEGHFAAVLQKEASGMSGEAPRPFREQPKEADAQSLSCWREFAAAYLRRDAAGRRIIRIQDRLYAADPAGLRPKLRYLRTGLYLGCLKKYQFEPSQALAMALKPGDVRSVVSFPCSDGRVIRYLKGETVPLSPTEAEGLLPWTLVCVDGYPLGWAKWVAGSLRNKYCIGWRMN